MIQIDERMYSVPEVARLTGHRPEYVRDLIEDGTLDAIRPTSRSGSRSQWRIYPSSLRAWLGVKEVRSSRSRTRQEKSELAAFEAITGRVVR